MLVHMWNEYELIVCNVNYRCKRYAEEDCEKGQGALQSIPTAILFVYDRHSSEEEDCNALDQPG
jgi:hypothetical protein